LFYSCYIKGFGLITTQQLFAIRPPVIKTILKSNKNINK